MTLLTRYVFACSAALLIAAMSVAQPTAVFGTAIDFGGKQISAYRYADHISQERILLDKTLIADDGSFALSFDLDAIESIVLSYDHITSPLFASPGAIYSIDIPLPPADVSRTFAKGGINEVIFDSLPDEDINALIIDFNYRYEDFFRENYGLLQRLASPGRRVAKQDSAAPPTTKLNPSQMLFQQVDAFSLALDTIYQEYDAPYFKIYRDCAMADLYQMRATPRETYERYLAPYPFKGAHAALTVLHREFFQNYFARYVRDQGMARLDSALNGPQAGYAAIEEILLEDDFLTDSLRRGLVALIALDEIWGDASLNRSKAIGILDDMLAREELKPIDKVIESMRRRLSSPYKGLVPADITMLDAYNEQVSISSYSDKPLIIEWWATWCSDCSAEQVALDGVLQEFADEARVLSIQLLEPGEKPQRLNDGRPGEVISASVAHDAYAVQFYRLGRLPTYILLDQEGAVAFDYTPLPSSGKLQNYLQSIKIANRDASKWNVGGKGN